MREAILLDVAAGFLVIANTTLAIIGMAPVLAVFPASPSAWLRRI